MQAIEYRTVDKSEWLDGPWKYEPDKKQWRDEATGLPCLIVRGPSGSLCGYVGVPPTHPAYGKQYDDVSVEVHGGLTFADKCAEAPTRESWERFKERGHRARGEAKRYPNGDAAQFLRARVLELSNYGAYTQWCEAAHICHKVEPGETDDVWWLGFDCAHLGDFSPAHAKARRPMRDETYKDLFAEQQFLEFLILEPRQREVKIQRLQFLQLVR